MSKYFHIKTIIINNYSVNCDSFCVFVLNKYKYNGINKYKKCDIWKMLYCKGVYVSRCKLVNTYIWFVILIAIICSVVVLSLLLS